MAARRHHRWPIGRTHLWRPLVDLDVGFLDLGLGISSPRFSDIADAYPIARITALERALRLIYQRSAQSSLSHYRRPYRAFSLRRPVTIFMPLASQAPCGQKRKSLNLPPGRIRSITSPHRHIHAQGAIEAGELDTDGTRIPSPARISAMRPAPWLPCKSRSVCRLAPAPAACGHAHQWAMMIVFGR